MRKKAKYHFDIDQIQLLKAELPQHAQIEFMYNGPFSKETINNLTQQITKLTKSDSQAYRKLFYVFIELTQNVSNYSDWRDEDKNVGIGALILATTDEQYIMLIGNVVNNDDLKVLIRKCEIINSLDRESLRLFKRQQRNLIPGTNQNAHIGLIMVALTTRKKLDITIKPIDPSYSFFILKIVIPRKQKVDRQIEK